MTKKSKTDSPNKPMPVTECDMDWRARSDCMTLQNAEEIKGDKKRHGAAKKHAAKEVKRLESVVKA